MSEMSQPATKAAVGRGGRSWLLLIVILIVLIVAAAGGGGYWFFVVGQRTASGAQVREPEAPLPFYLEVKPFVVSMVNSTGAPHFVQLGLNLTLPGSEAGSVVTGVLPEVQDAMRQTVLTFKVEDIVTPPGIEKMREALIANVNQVLLQRFGADRIKRLNGDETQGAVVRNIYFTTLIVE